MKNKTLSKGSLCVGNMIQVDSFVPEYYVLIQTGYNEINLLNFSDELGLSFNRYTDSKKMIDFGLQWNLQEIDDLETLNTENIRQLWPDIFEDFLISKVEVEVNVKFN